jgi:translation initiation factor 1 (eIF-1/SUI1)
VANLNDLEIVRNIKRELVRMRKEIGTITNVEEKKEALKAYAELLTNLEIGTLPKERRSG